MSCQSAQRPAADKPDWFFVCLGLAILLTLFLLAGLLASAPAQTVLGYMPDLTPELLQQLASGDLAAPGIRLENPLLRSGLGLAGANLRKSGNDDGILTALEVAGLNLWGTKLVVLSACDTGVGEVKNGEGVYGLRRALVLAGAETQVMSLWPVSDQGTRELMTEYYKGLQSGQGRSEAMRQVQLRMRANPKRAHPYYWASLIVSGEWANLEGRR